MNKTEETKLMSITPYFQLDACTGIAAKQNEELMEMFITNSRDECWHNVLIYESNLCVLL